MGVPMRCCDCGTRYESSDGGCPACAVRRRWLVRVVLVVFVVCFAVSVGLVFESLGLCPF